jgi:serine/threonine kinase PknH
MSDAGPGSRVGSRVGPYQLRRLLGRGGMGEVYEAYDTVKDRVVAVKLMSAEVSRDPVFRARMQREAHTAGRLQEPHVVPIHNYGEIDGQLFIEMRFIEGTDLGALLNRLGPLPPSRAVAIVRQVAAALDAAHAAGVMHRDIKPENILITGEDFAYLVDFGIAATVTDERLTGTGAAIGTWDYMAPERFSAAEVTYRADIYALACVLFQCLTAAVPYRADSLSMLVAAHLYEPVPRPSQLRAGIPAGFDEVIVRGMAKDPVERYPAAGDLARAAYHALSASDQDQAVSILRRSQQSGLSAAEWAATLIPAPPSPISWSQSPTTPPFAPAWTQLPVTPPLAAPPWPPAPARAPRGRNPWLLLGIAALVVIAVLGGLGIWRGTRDQGGATQRLTGTPTPTTTTSIATTTTTTMTTVPAARLDSILLSAAEINAIMGATNMQPSGTATVLEKTPYTLSVPDCLGPLFVAQASVYTGSGYTAASGQAVREPGANPDHGVIQAAVAFLSADRAGAFVTASAAKWKACAGQTITETDNGRTSRYTFGDLIGDAPNITQLDTQEGSGGWACQRVLRAVSTVVLDVAACGHHISDQGSRIADAMAANATK